jgi:hypothetical protein
MALARRPLLEQQRGLTVIEAIEMHLGDPSGVNEEVFSVADRKEDSDPFVALGGEPRIDGIWRKHDRGGVRHRRSQGWAHPQRRRGQQTQDAGADRQSFRWLASRQAQRGGERIFLWSR